MKKIQFSLPGNVCFYLTKLLLFMKLTTFLLFINLVSFAATGYSQAEKVTIQLKDASIKDLFSTIEHQTSYKFLYRDDAVENIRVNLDEVDIPLDKILDQILEGSKFGYKILANNLIVIAPNDLFQQTKVSGTITGKDGTPLPGVNVVVTGKTLGTITDINGKYSIDIPQGAKSLTFSFIGMESQGINIGTLTQIDVTMTESAIGLNEVVVVGYGTQKKGELTSAIVSVKSDDFIKGSITNVAQLLTGKIAGLSVVKPDADPVKESEITLRGVTSLKAGAEPLVIIDGIPGSLSSVSPMDIESIDVLKDGSAAAIYGTRGSNGVILITTQKINKEMPLTIDVKSNVAIQSISKRLDFMSATQYRNLVVQGKPGAIDNGGNTNWLDEIIQNPISSIYNVTMKAGNANGNYIINMNYEKLEGLIRKSDNNVFTPRLEVNQSLFNGKLKINGNILGKEQKYFSGIRTDVYRSALGYNPTDPVKDENGVWTEHPGINNYSNPVALLEETQAETVNTSLKTYGSIIFIPTENLSLNLVASHGTNNMINGYSETKKHISTVRDSKNGVASRAADKNYDDFIESFAQYKKSINKHNIVALIGYSWQKSRDENFYMYNFDFPSDLYSFNNMASGQALQRGEAQMSSYKQETKLIGYFFRLNYNYENKYILMASIRREGSSKFGNDQKWGNFPAVSIGWNIKNETFMKDIDFLSNIKIRAGYGVTGTEPTAPYMSQSRLGYGSSYLLNGIWTPVIMPLTNANPDLRWERKEETNIGLDFGFFKDRLSGSIDLYKRTTKDLLWDYNVPEPPYLYSTITANAGVMENKGLEMQLRGVPIQGSNFRWISTLNFSTNRNKLVSLSNDKFVVQGGYFDTGYIGEPIQETTHRIQVGQPIGNFWTYQTIDVDANGYWIILGQDGNPKPIEEATASDKRVVGNGLPKYYLSWNNTFTYKHLDLDINMRGAFDYQIINYARIFYEAPINLARGNILNSAYNDVFGKRPLNDLQDYKFVSYYIENGDYWKIDNVTLGYNFDTKGTFIKQLRLFASVQNFLVITKYSGIDPEVSIGGLAPGADDRDRYPSTRSFAFGVNINF